MQKVGMKRWMCLPGNNDYKNLREEIMYSRKAQDKYAIFLYTTVVTILGFAFQFENYYLCLLPIVIIIPVCIKIADYRRTIAYLATYMIAFLEKDEYKWETDNFMFSNKFPRKGLERFIHILENYDAFILNVICTLIFVVSVIYNSFNCQSNICLELALSVISGLTCVVVFLITRTYSDYQQLKASKLSNWNKYKTQKK